MFHRADSKRCEICAEDISKIKHRHHIIPRTDPRCSNIDSNLAYLCPNCHYKVHQGDFIIEGVYQTSSGKFLFWHKAGESYTIRPGVFIQSDGTAKIIEA